MNKNKKKWTGCFQILELEVMTRAASELASMEKLDPPLELVVKIDKGIGPEILTSKKFAFRFGPASFPLTGFGQLVESFVGEWIAAIVFIETLLSKGIVLADFSSFAQTTAGVEFLNEEEGHLFFQ